MEILEFLIGDERLPVYRTVTAHESEMLRALLGQEFHFELEDGEPLDELLFEVLSTLAMRADFFLSLPPDASVLGTFSLRDASLPRPGPRTASRPGRRGRVH